ncbi:MAG: OmpA family protein, partial [Bacteroidota bacterium]
KAIAQAKGGTGIYTFKWDSGETTFNAVKLTEGNHTVTATDANGCVATATVKIDAKVDAFAVILREARPVRCYGEKTNLTVAAVGGKTPYKEYKWSPAIKLSDGVGAGTYSVTATDAAGTTATATIVIKEPKKLTVSTLLQSGTSPGKADGKALAIVEGGTGSMFFRWDNSEATAATNELTPGLHYVTVTDENACTQTASVFIPEGIDPLKVTLNERDRIKCSGGKAVLEVKASGGKEPYQYVWSVSSVKGTNPAVAAGDYMLTVTDGSGTTVSASVRVKQPDLLAATVTVNAPAGIGASDGKATVDITGGTTPYKISWDNGEDAREASRLSAGRHTVSVTDANACAATATVVVTENILPLSVVVRETTPIKCPGEKAGLEVSVTGGKSPFRYVWSVPSLAGERTSAPAGTYSVTLTDAAGTTASAAIQVSQPAQLAVVATATSPAGVGASDGKATVTATGGTAPYTFSWSSGETGASAARLSDGKHGVTATDANGCAAAASLEITENILPLATSVSETVNIKCAGQKASLEVKISGGKGPFKYVWNTPSVTGASPGVSAGEYTVTVTDAVGTTASASVKINQPAQLTISASMKSPAGMGAADGKALAKINGGTEPYSIIWSNGETAAEATALKSGAHTVTVTDANSCTAATGLGIDENIPPLTISLAEIVAPRCAGDKTTLSADVNGGKKPYKFVWSDPGIESGKPVLLSTGMYGFTVTDATGNTASSSISVKMPAQLSAAVEVQAPASTGGTDGKATLKATGGVQPFTFSWSSGETTAAAAALPPGKQSVTVTDANGCVAATTFEIRENILVLTATLTEEKSIKCAGDKAALRVKVTGGKGPFTYAWNNPAATGDTPSDLDAGNYTVTVTDVKGATKTASVTLKAVTPLEVTLVRNIGATSERNSDGKAELSVKGGTPRYSIIWDTKQTGLSAPKLALGKHSVTVTDANGCTKTIDFETEKRIRPELTGSLENGQTIRMRLLNFDTDSSTIKPEALPMLDELFDFMTENSAVMIEIAGHTNNLPSDAFADQLSTARAKAVADYLATKGIDSKRLVYKGYGKRLPLVPNTSAEGRKTNQRVEIKILKG